MMTSKSKQKSKDIAFNKKLRFWLFQFCGWLPFYWLQLAIFGEADWASFKPVLFATSVTFLSVAGSLLLRKAFHFFSRKEHKKGLWELLITLMCLPMAALVVGIHQLIWFVIAIEFGQFATLYQNQPYTAVAAFVWVTYVVWCCLYLLFTKHKKLSDVIIKQQKLELLVKENQINSLLEKLNPHFMFNTINNIRALILKDSEQARDMLSSFADIMRYQINSNDDALVPLKDELDFVLEYIELNRLQLGKRLIFDKQIELGLLNNCIPRMALQLLVENAIKHGFSQSAKPAILKIIISEDVTGPNPQGWFLSVQNNGTINNDNSNSGIGLKNLEERLKLSFSQHYKLSLTEENNIVECKIVFDY